MKFGIRFKIISFITSLLLLVILLLSVLVLNGIKKYQVKENEAILLSQKNLFEQYLYESLRSDISIDNKFYLEEGNLFDKPWLNSMPVNVYDIKGKLIYAFGNDGKTDVIGNENDILAYTLKNKIAYKTVNSNIYYYSPLKYKGSTVAMIRFKYSIKQNIDFYNKVKNLFIILGCISLVIGIFMGTIYFIGFTNDIDKIAYSIENIKNGNFNEIKRLKRNDELGELSKGISFMSRTIEKNIYDLKNAVEKLKILSGEQKNFLSSITHEFKTPLTSIKAYGDLLQMYENDPELIGEASQNISKECERLYTMIDNVLKLTALDEYDFEVKKTTFNLKDTIEQICSRMMGKIRKNNLRLEYSINNITMRGDEDGLRHVLINLIDNAIKYNIYHGIVYINAKSEENNVYIEIEDTGIGIPQEELVKIFKPYYRVQSDRSRKSGGNGLGLAFVKKMVEKQKGTISVISKEKSGSKFMIILPIDN